MSINNFDYVWITLFFSVVGLCAYFFRNKNKTGNDFLFAKTKIDGVLLYAGGFGIIEITLASLLGSKSGFSALYTVLIVVFIIGFLLANVLKNRYINDGVTNFNDYVYNQLGHQTSNVVAVISVLLFLSLSVIAECITFKLLHSLLGWNFVNSIIGIMGLILIYLIIGGVASFKYNSLIQISLVILTIILMSVFVIFEIGGVNVVVNNLSNLAVANNHAMNFYTMPHLTSNSVNGFVIFLIGFGGFYFVCFSSTKNNNEVEASNSFSFLIKVLLAIILITPGILAISAKMPHKILDGKEIVTIQAQLADGQTGYIVKAIDSNSNKINKEPGLIPPVIDTKTGLAIPDSYDYDLASVVIYRQYLPKILSFLLVLLVLSGFMLAFASYILHVARIILRNIIIPNKIFEKYGDAREIWVIRVSILVFAVLATAIAEIYAPYFLFIQALYVISAIFLAPLFATVILSVVCNERKGYFAILTGVLIALILIFIMKETNQLYKYALITLVSFIVTFITGLLLKNIKK